MDAGHYISQGISEQAGFALAGSALDVVNIQRATTVLLTSLPVPAATPGERDGRPVSQFRWPRSPGGSARFVWPPSCARPKLCQNPPVSVELGLLSAEGHNRPAPSTRRLPVWSH